MMKFFTLAELEWKKMLPFMTGVFSVGMLIHIWLVLKSISGYKEELLMAAQEAQIPLEEYIQTASPAGLAMILDQSPFSLVILFFTALIFIMYGLFMWYKEWFGASKRIYMLLSIRGSRMRIFFSKLLPFTMAIMIFNGLLLVCLQIDTWMMQAILPEGSYVDHLFQDGLFNSIMMSLLFSQGLADFLYQICFAMMMFTIMSVFVLLDRSKRIFGAMVGFIYGISTIVIFVYYKTLPLYTTEKIMADWAFVVFITLLSTGISYFLLKKKISI